MKSKYGSFKYINKKKKEKKFQKPETKQKEISCKCCGYSHVPDKIKCPAWGKSCSLCKARNHFAKKCSKVLVVQNSDSSSNSDVAWINAIKINSADTNDKEVHAKMLIDTKPVKFQLDCGASVNLLPIKYIGKREVIPNNRTLVMWNGAKAKPAGARRINIHNSKTGKKYSVELVMVNEDLTPLLGLQATERMN